MKLTAENLSVGYEGHTVYGPINLQVEKGRLLALVGPNGVGKSTLLKTMAGILPPLGGAVLLTGQDLGTFSSKMRARHICYLPQNYTPFLPYRVREAIMMGRAPYIPLWRGPRQHDIDLVNQVITSLDIGHLADKECTELSGGEQRLLLIARALVQEPDFLLLDEPAAALDANHEAKLLEILEQLLKQGMGMIMATHNPEHAEQLGGVLVSLGK